MFDYFSEVALSHLSNLQSVILDFTKRQFLQDHWYLHHHPNPKIFSTLIQNSTGQVIQLCFIRTHSLFLSFSFQTPNLGIMILFFGIRAASCGLLALAFWAGWSATWPNSPSIPFLLHVSPCHCLLSRVATGRLFFFRIFGFSVKDLDSLFVDRWLCVCTLHCCREP